MELLKRLKIPVIMTIIIILFLVIFTNLFVNKLDSHNKEYSKENQRYDINSSDIKYEEKDIVIKGKETVKLFNVEKKEIIELPLEEYVKGVVAAEVPAEFNEEALKAQSVAARTFYISKREEPCPKANGADICNTTHCQVHISKEEASKKWGTSKANEYWDKISKAVEETKGQVITYEGEIIKYPQFFSISAGKTENAIDVFSNDIPYLKSIDSPGEEIAKKYETVVEIKKKDFISKINKGCPSAKLTENNLNSVKVLSRTEGNGVKELAIGEAKITGVEFRKILGINSTNFNISITDSVVKIDCKGYGHRVGMSQWGANVMAKEGKRYDDILRHYYSGTDIKNIIFKD